MFKSYGSQVDVDDIKLISLRANENILLYREREEDKEMAAFLQSKFPKTLASKGES